MSGNYQTVPDEGCAKPIKQRPEGGMRPGRTWRREAKWWERQVAHQLCPQGSSTTQSRRVPRQIWHWKSSRVLLSAVV